MIALKRGFPILLALFLVFGIAGCTDVAVNPKSSISANNALAEQGGYRAYLAKLYAGLAVVGQDRSDQNADLVDVQAGLNDPGWSTYTRVYWALQQLPTDAAVLAWNDQSIQDFNDNSWSSADPFIRAMYSRIYFQAAQVNEFLRQSTQGRLDERGVSREVRNHMPQWRAEARFLRALSYWHGVDMFGDIPLVTEEFTRGAEAPDQNTRQEVFEFVEQELLKITGEVEGEAPNEVLPDAGQSEYGRVDKAAAWMVLAKLYQNAPVYIGEMRHQDVIEYTTKIIDSGAFSLEDEYHDLFLADNHTSDEFILAVPSDGNSTQSFGGSTFLAHAPVGGTLNGIATDSLGIDGGWFGLRTLPNMVDRYAADDTRPMFPNIDKDSTLNGTGQWYKGAFQTKSVGDLRNFSNGLLAPKYQNVTSNGQPGSDQLIVDTDFPMFRLADAYLMYAEAVVRAGENKSRAVSLINDLRERAFGDQSGNISASELTLDFIIDERARELFWEGHRRTDLIRFGQYAGDDYTWAWKGGTQGGSSISEDLRLYPIPRSELQSNPNIEQNPGY